ncbi:hypothetical protein PP175_10585 [Aneurinibacillus sp. Ricciae_BoGa-3]|uniref:hypothetical protein n=1 Tax=Aneurinibacillus sp. Ricciae_BoGa-3 TaxID=3022697 RepID=UPI00233FF365|nr:hypothetical protein [Aneurinibacillus sp. Ricciae_BoGa-3]WCK56316.1 hypothetical protein PP175_10585 [Aneurinibacillus sp. Ricciae_BoGa-3]
MQNQLVSNVPSNILAVHAPDVWHKSTGKGIRVGVLDTGIARSHPALRVKSQVDIISFRITETLRMTMAMAPMYPES